MCVDFLFVPEEREDHIARHGVSVAEVYDVVYGNSTQRRSRYGRYRLIGQTGGGRYLVVIVKSVAGSDYVLVTARDATDRERREFRSQRRY